MRDFFIKGMDLSTLPEVERCGGRFYDHGAQGDAVDILKGYGMNMVRLRLWNDPYSEDGAPYGAGGCDLETVLSLAGRVKEKGLSWLLDFHYSDFWADPGKQILPKKWRRLNVEGLERAVYDYTAEALLRCERQGVSPCIAAVGNELTNGLLWPYGKVPEYGNIARFVSAGIRAVRDVNPDISVMIHLDNGGNNELYRRWFDHYLENRGEDFDYIGLSYYPFWHGSLALLEANMRDLAIRYGKEMIVAEVSMGHTVEDYQSYEKLGDKERKGMATTPELTAQVPYPMTVPGQADFMRDFLETLGKVPEGMAKGFFTGSPDGCLCPEAGGRRRRLWPI